LLYYNIMKQTDKTRFYKLLLAVIIFAFTASCDNSMPFRTVTTTAVTDVTSSTATAGGKITNDNNIVTTSQGVCWSTNTGPTINDSKTTSTTITVDFTGSITGLTPNTTYYVRAYLSNSDNTVYGNELSFTTAASNGLALTTTAATGVTTTAATAGGNIASDGGSTITARGVCWGTTTAPTITNSKTTDGTGTGVFASSLTGLLPNTLYYIRAYATNATGTVYGNELTFTTPQTAVLTLTSSAATAITTTTASTGGNIVSDGGSAVTARGVCWSTTAAPTTAGSKTTDGTGTGVFASSLTGLSPNTLYYVRAYATNANGTAYGNEVTFTTSQATAVALTTTAATGIATTAATSGGNITSDGGLVIIARGVCWNTSTAPTITNSKTSDGTGMGIFASSITGLQANTKYYVRSYATNILGTTYGNEISFTTPATAVLTLTTTAASSVGTTTATAGGNITSDGGASVTARGVCWSTSTGPTTSSSITANGLGTGTFTSSLTGLIPGTTYYLRAYATNANGTVYGNEVTFTTTALLVPTLTTTAASAIAITTATAGGSISSDGGSAVTARGVCWNTASGPTTANSKTSDGTGTGAFTSSLTGLVTATKYYVRAYATNAIGTAYGNEVSFTTTSAVTNTPGTLTISTLTSSAGGQYSPRNVVAIWIENSSGVFVKSLLVLANARKGDLTNWSSNTAKNVVNATTGATQSSHAVRTATWNGTNVSGVVVTDGIYKACFELTDGTLRFSTFNFTKGSVASTVSPANVSSFANISIVWTP